MAIITRRRVGAPTPRQLVLKSAFENHHAIGRPAVISRVVARAANAGEQDPAYIEPPLLPSGQEQLYSFYAPSLGSGLHHISVTQRVTPPSDSTGSRPLNLTATQDFIVVKPRFSLPDGEVHSVYPPPGHGDQLNIVPHIVLTDPHLPWERNASTSNGTAGERNRVPWLALLVFTQDELKLPSSQLAGEQRIFPEDVKQSETWSVNMSIDDLWKMQDNKTVATPIANSTDDPIDATTSAMKSDMIFVPGKLYEDLFRSYDALGSPVTSQTKADVSRYKYLSHMRNINTVGQPENQTGGDDQGLFSVVVAHRTGPWTIQQPTPVTVHLVSIEGIETLSHVAPAPLVALCSLSSWTYQCLPTTGFNTFDAMQHLGSGTNTDALRPVSSYFEKLVESTDPVQTMLGRRMRDGFSMSHYRVSTGERTIAMTRGPFVPTKVDHITLHQSSFSSDLQILDQETGIMDVSYSLAWQLGKTMAIADQAFTAALSRIRMTIHKQAYQAVKGEIIGDAKKNLHELVPRLSKQIATLASLHEGPVDMDAKQKWSNSVRIPQKNMSFFSPEVRAKFLDEAKKAARTLASSTDSTDKQYLFHNEHNTATSTDWALMLKWLLERMSFYAVPAHYLITDPTHLPKETIRFFTVDPNWVDALIDGALSIANHIEGDDDQIRTAIKSTLEDYLRTVDPQIKYVPQIPKSGFLLRSALVTKFPNLIVTAPWEKNAGQAPILRHEVLSEDVMLVLFDRTPGDGLLKTITISQPPHQQCFAAADEVGPDSADITKTVFRVGYKKIYTTPTAQQPTDDDRKKDLTTTTWTYDSKSPCPVFHFESRMLVFPNYADVLLQTLRDNMPAGQFTDDISTSALVGLQLNEPMYQFEIVCASPPAQNVVATKQTKVFTRSSGTSAVKTPPVLKMLQTRDRFATAQVANDRKLAREVARASLVTPLPPPIAAMETSESSSIQKQRILPVHVRAAALPLAAAQDKLPPSGTLGPQFKITCHPAGAALASPIPTKTGYPIDLIFGVIMTGSADSLSKLGYKLVQLRVDIQLGDTSSPQKLISYYAGTNGRMLSNLRWNPIVTPASVPTLLYVNLLPRSMSGAQELQRSRNMSFILSGVDVNPYAVPQNFIITVWEIYVNKGIKTSQMNQTCRVVLQPPHK